MDELAKATLKRPTSCSTVPAMRTSRFVKSLLAAAVAALIAPSVGCNGDDAADPDDGDGDTSTYTTRGEIEGLPGDEGGTVQIFHEEIPDFVDREGETTGMAAMSMPFGVADDVALDDVDRGDLIEFTFEVDWDESPALTVTSLELLPEDTEIDRE